MICRFAAKNSKRQQKLGKVLIKNRIWLDWGENCKEDSPVLTHTRYTRAWNTQKARRVSTDGTPTSIIGTFFATSCFPSSCLPAPHNQTSVTLWWWRPILISCLPTTKSMSTAIGTQSLHIFKLKRKIWFVEETSTGDHYSRLWQCCLLWGFWVSWASSRCQACLLFQNN